MSKMSSPYKHPLSGTYYLRKAVPKHLVPIIGKTVFKQSLRTKDPHEAKKRIIPLLADIDQQLDYAELTLKGETTQELSQRDCYIVASRWYASERDRVQRTDSFDDYVVYHNGENEGLHLSSSKDSSFDVTTHPHWFGIMDTLSLSGSEVLRASHSKLETLAKELSEFIDPQLKKEGISIPHSSPSYIRLAKVFYKFLGKLETLCLKRHKGDWSYEPIDISFASEPLYISSQQESPTKCRVSATNSISKVYEQWRASDLLQNKDNQARLKTLDETKAKVERFVAIIGDKDISSIKKSDIARYRDTLLQLPKNRTQEVKLMSIPNQIKYAETNNAKLLSPKTVANAIKQISPVFTYAVDMGLISSNPTTGISVKNTQKKTEADVAGRGYSAKDTTKLFSDELFTRPSLSHTYGLACYWIPLLCRYTGARLSEIAQLDRSDVGCSDEGIHYLNIRRGKGQSIKTDSSLRHIPIPAHILELGFLDYVNKSKGRLFPDLTTGTYGKYSGAFSKWWSAKVKSKGITISQPTHAFRHAFKTEMRAIGVSDSVSDSITGHAAKSEGGRYGSVPLTTKKEAIDKLPRLNLKRIY